MKKIAVIGSLNMDLVTKTEKLPQIGETIKGLSFMTVCGGKGGNQACAASKLGGKVSMFGCVGEDLFGQKLISSLQKQGVDCSEVCRSENHESGTASITVCNGDNSIIIQEGANALVTESYIDKKLDAIKRADFIILQLEIPIKTVEYIIRIANEYHIPVMLNPSPTAELPEEILKMIEYFIVNETECEFYSGIRVKTEQEAKDSVQKLKQRGIRNVIITMGSHGSVFNAGEDTMYYPARKVKAVDSTAAGDTFTAAVVVALLERKSIQEAIRFATKASSITVSRNGAQSSIPSRMELE